MTPEAAHLQVQKLGTETLSIAQGYRACCRQAGARILGSESLPRTRQLSDVGLVLGEVRRRWGARIHRRGESRRYGSREGFAGGWKEKSKGQRARTKPFHVSSCRGHAKKAGSKEMPPEIKTVLLAGLSQAKGWEPLRKAQRACERRPSGPPPTPCACLSPAVHPTGGRTTVQGPLRC